MAQPIELLSQAIHKKEALLSELDSKIDNIKQAQLLKIQSSTNYNKIVSKNDKVEFKMNKTSIAYQTKIGYWQTELTKNEEHRNKAINDVNYKYDTYREQIMNNIKTNEAKLEEQEEKLQSKINDTPTLDEDNILSLSKIKFERIRVFNELNEMKIQLAKMKDERDRYIERSNKENQRAIVYSYSQEEKSLHQKQLDEYYAKQEQEKEEEKLIKKKVEENKLKNPLEYIPYDEKKELMRQYKKVVKDFKLNHKHIFDNYKIVLNDKSEEYIVEHLVKRDMDALIELTNDNDINDYINSKFLFYKRKIVFENHISNKLTTREESIYYHLDNLVENGLEKFFEINDISKQKRFLKKHEKEFDYKYGED